MEDALPYALGGRPRFVLDRVEPQGVREVSYPVRAEVRGRYRVGPLSVRLTDPFGLCELTRSFAEHRRPRRHAGRQRRCRASGSVATGPAAARPPRGRSRSRRQRRRGHPRVPPRRRPAQGALALDRPRRRADGAARGAAPPEPRDPAARRAGAAHRGDGPARRWSGPSAPSPASAVVAVARRVRPAAARRPRRRPGAPRAAGHGGGGARRPGRRRGRSQRQTLDGATYRLRRERRRGRPRRRARRRSSADDAERLSRLRHGAGACVAVLLDTDTWAHAVARPAPQRRDDVRRARPACCGSAGWRVLRVAHGTTLASVWPRGRRLCRPLGGPAMSLRTQLTLAGAVAVLLSCAALFPLFGDSDWSRPSSARCWSSWLPAWPAGGSGCPACCSPCSALLVLAVLRRPAHAAGTLSYGLLPTGQTVDVASTPWSPPAGPTSQEYGPPVPTTEGLVLLTAAGVGLRGRARRPVAVDLRPVRRGGPAAAGAVRRPLRRAARRPRRPAVRARRDRLAGLLLVEGSERVSRWGTPLRSRPGARTDESSLGRVGRRIGVAAVAAGRRRPAAGARARRTGCSAATAPGADGAGDGGPARPAPTTRSPGCRSSSPCPSRVSCSVLRTDDPEPDYLRMTTLDTYTGHGLAGLAADADREGGPGAGGHPDARSATAARTATPRMQVADRRGTWTSTGCRCPTARARSTSRAPGCGTRAARRSSPRRAPPGPAALQGARPAGCCPTATPSPPRRTPASTPEIDGTYGGRIRVAPYVEQLTRQVVAGARRQYDKAVAIQRYFTNPATASSTTSTPSQATDGGDPLEAFLRGKHGFCEQYATAMAVHAAGRRDPVSGRGRLHPRHHAGQGRVGLQRHDQRRPRLARGVVRRHRLGAVRADPGGERVHRPGLHAPPPGGPGDARDPAGP